MLLLFSGGLCGSAIVSEFLTPHLHGCLPRVSLGRGGGKDGVGKWVVRG